MALSTKLQKVEYIIDWKINLKKQKHEPIASELFYTDVGMKSSWQILFNTVNHPPMVKLYLISGPTTAVSVKFFCMNRGQDIFKTDKLEQDLKEKESTPWKDMPWYHENYCDPIIRCRLRIDAKNISSGVLSVEDMNSFTKDIHALRCETKYADVLIRSHDAMEFRAHKSILSVRSEVFAAMLQSNMKESVEGVIEINDMDGNTIDVMLNYIYSGKLSNYTEALCLNLFIAADKYNLTSLQNTCSTYLRTLMTVEGCVKTLIFADIHNEYSLKDFSLDFIARNAAAVSSSNDWKTLRQNYPHLVDELIIKMSKTYEPSFCVE